MINITVLKFRVFFRWLLPALLTAAFFCGFAAERFEVSDGQFMLDSKPIIIKAAELHYPRIPEPYWRHRIRMSKALGMNTICVYIFWNYHEERPGEFDFSGNRDVRKFIEMCGEEGMNVIVRPGPYVCAEWEMGGLPWWLLKEKDVQLRENDPRFLSAVSRFQDALAKELRGLTVDEGGPIIMMQVENEYGSYGIDKEYVANIRDILRSHYPETLLFQCDWSSNFTQNGLDDLLWTLNFGTWADPEKEFAELHALRPDSPLMCSEYWSGWFDKWGANHETRPAHEMVDGIRKMLDNDISFSLYMTHGGTNFGHWAGANSPGYAPDVTSYDYDAPIDEAGNPTPKYHLLRSLLGEYSDSELPEVPASLPVAAIDEFSFDSFSPLYPLLENEVISENPLTMEMLDQGYGSVVYVTTLGKSSVAQKLDVKSAHDYALVYLDGEYLGKLDRRFYETSLMIPPHDGGVDLTIFVEATGRINFGRSIKDFKGITDSVTLDGNELKNWRIYCIKDDYDLYQVRAFDSIETIDDKDIKWRISSDRILPGFYRGFFNVDTPHDTWLDLSGLGKGVAYLNGHPLGRFWEIGPQQTLYAPGCWMKEGRNELLVFDVKGGTSLSVRGYDAPVYDCVREVASEASDSTTDNFNTTDRHIITEGRVREGEWVEDKFEPFVSRYVMLEGDSADVSLAEFYLIDENGEVMPRESWKIYYVSSEQKDGNHTADKILDLQETTYWTPASDCQGDQAIVVDLGTPQRVSAMKLFGGRGKSEWKLLLSVPESM